MSTSKRIATNTLYLALGKVFSTALGVLTVALLLRYFSVDDYGRYTTVLAFILLFGTFVDFGLNLTTTQDISLPGRDVPKTLSAIFTFRLLVNVILVLLLPVILLAFPYEQTVKDAILISSVLFFTFSLFQVLASYFQMMLEAGKVAFAELCGRMVLLITTAIAIYFQFSFLQIMLTIAAASLVQFWVLLRFTASRIKLQLAIDWEIWKRIMSKTWPIALSVIFTTIYFKGDAIILSLTRPYEDVGIYGAAYKILEVLITLPILFMGLVLPYLSRQYSQNDKPGFNQTIQKAWDALSAITIPLVVGTLILAEPIMELIAGNGYGPSASVLRILIVATGFIFLGSLFSHAVVAIGKQKAMIKYYVAAAVLAVVLYIIYIPLYSYYAAAIVTVLSEFLIAVAAGIMVWRASWFKLSLRGFFAALIASMVMGAVLYSLSEFNVLIVSLVGIAVYALMLWMMRSQFSFNRI
ncbi:MAG: flippase [bacterium]|nr:flippase [bacterium]